MHICLDLDGVVADFASAAFQLFGKQYDESTYPRGEWDIAKVIGVPESDFWGTIANTENFWESLEPYPWKDELVRILEPYEVTVATSPARGLASRVGKMRWIDKHLPYTNVYLGNQKYRLALDRSCLLIDDKMETCRKFWEQGGCAACFPQPWNVEEDFRVDSKREHFLGMLPEYLERRREEHEDEDE